MTIKEYNALQNSLNEKISELQTEYEKITGNMDKMHMLGVQSGLFEAKEIITKLFKEQAEPINLLDHDNLFNAISKIANPNP
jgi:SUMO ligase MMS21 Smc5/6 complex component